MDHFLAMGLAVILIIGSLAAGLQAYDIYSAVVSVRSALTVAELQLSTDGGVSDRVMYLVSRRLQADKRDLGRVQVGGTPPGTPWGGEVTLTVVYEHPYLLTRVLPELRWVGYSGTFRVEKSLTTVSGKAAAG